MLAAVALLLLDATGGTLSVAAVTALTGARRASNTAAILRPATVRVLSWRKRGDLRRVGVGEAANTGADEVAVAVSTLSTPTSECTIFASG
jgi:hypothetical protein